MQQITVHKREHISGELKAVLKANQHGRCGSCGDLLKMQEVHHRKPVAVGGTDDIDNLVMMRSRQRKTRAGVLRAAERLVRV